MLVAAPLLEVQPQRLAVTAAISYDPCRTEGLTDEDMVEVLRAMGRASVVAGGRITFANRAPHGVTKPYLVNDTEAPERSRVHPFAAKCPF
jgi:hypothetical protein